MIKKNPSIQELKKFAIMMSWAMPLFFLIITPWLFNYSRHWWPLAVSVIFLVLLLAPKKISYPYKLWMLIGSIVGWINTRIILGLTFYLLIFPMGLVLRLLGKLQYIAFPKKTKSSYYKFRSQKLIKQDLEKPF